MTSSADEEGGREKDEGLAGLDLDTAKLDDLSQALGRLESEKRGLLEDIRVLRVRLADEKEDQSDVYYYLHKKLDDNYDVISALERQLMVETADREKAETEYARQIDELEVRRDEELGPLREKLVAEEEQLNGMHEAVKNKREADANRARLEAEIKATKSMVENDLNTERRKKLQEKQRVRRQVEDEIKELSSELFSKKEVELADKTVRAKDNNEKLHAALQAKAKQAERMMVMNQGLAFENRSLKNDVDLAKASEVVLDRHVRLYHNLVINLKARLEQEACDAEEADNKEQELAELEESLASGGGGIGDSTVPGLDTISLISDTPPGAQIVWAGGACGALAYESVDELRVAVESLQRLHAELQEEARHLTARVEESKAAGAASRMPGSGDDADRDPIVSCLVGAAEAWMALSRTTRPGERERHDGAEGDASYLARLPGTAPLHCDGDKDGGSSNSGRRGSLLSGRSDRRSTSGRDTGSSKRGRAVSARKAQTPGRGERGPRGLMLEQSQTSLQQSSSAGWVGNGGGTLEAATNTPARRRELFYHLVDAFREYQTRRRSQQSAVGIGDADGEQRLVGGGERVEESASVTGSTVAAGAEGGGGELPPISASCGGGGATASASDFSVSVRTLCDLGPPDCRDVSTQTVAKHFPEKFALVRPARRLVVNSSTFLTANSTVTNSVLSASTVRSWGYGEISLDSQPDRRL